MIFFTADIQRSMLEESINIAGQLKSRDSIPHKSILLCDYNVMKYNSCMAGMEYAENTDSPSSVNPKLVLYSSDVVVTTLGSLSSKNIDSFKARVMPVIPL